MVGHRFEPAYERAFNELWKLYLFTAMLGWTQIVKGIEFFRCVENYWFFQYFRAEQIAGKKIVDVGPWKSPLPAFMAHEYRAKVTVVDVLEGIREQLYYSALVRTELSSCVIDTLRENEPVRFNLPDNEFDICTCISTIEHFAGDLDMGIMSEIHRVLKPGGYVYISVPFGAEFEEGQHFIWDEKRHNQQSIHERLVNGFEGSTFEIVHQMYFKDERTLKFTNKYWALPRWGRLLFGRFWILFASHYIKTDRATSFNASLTGFVLKKAN